MATVTQMLDGQLAAACQYGNTPAEGIYVEHHYNTISIFGGRGTGKSSFLYSLLKKYEEDHPNVCVLHVIDPTMIEDKGHVFLLVVSLINDAVNRHMENKELEVGTETYSNRKEWRDCLQNLAFGLPSLENVGQNYATDDWENDGYIMRTGLRNVSSALHLERNFHRLIDKALTILGKQAFFLAFDDIDVDMKKGWPVLETLRKYLTSPKLLILLSGNYRLYSNNVRQHQWEQIKPLQEFESEEKKSTLLSQVDELERQYLLKVLKVKNRVHLQSLGQMLTAQKLDVTVQLSQSLRAVISSSTNTPALADVYQQLLRTLGVQLEQPAFRNFLLGLPIRSQIQYLRAHHSIEAFASSMYSSNIAIDPARLSPSMAGIELAKYLLSSNQWIDSYLLIPSSASETQNSSLFGFNLLYAEHTGRFSHTLFDYMLRIGYMRNVLLNLSNDERTALIEHSSLTHDISLKNILGLVMAFVGQSNKLGEHTMLYGLSKKAKGSGKGRIDSVLSEESDARRTLGYIPLMALTAASSNTSTLYYSLFAVLAAITEILRESSSEADIKAALDDMALSRSYIVADNNVGQKASFGNDEEEPAPKQDDGSLDEFAKAIMKWKSLYPFKDGEVVAPYLCGRIMTRVFSAVRRIKQPTAGLQMELCVAALLNACLVEEAKDRKLIGLNSNNPVTKTDILKYNLAKVNLDQLPLSRWMLACPLLTCYLSGQTLTQLGIAGNAAFSVTNVLDKVLCKKAKVTFRYGTSNIDETVNLLKDYDFDIENDVIACTDDEARANLLETGLFGANLTSAGIASFKKNYKIWSAKQAKKTE